MSETDARSLAMQKKRRGVVRASLTRLNTKLTELEGSTDQSGTLDLARRLSTRLEVLDSEYKHHHYAIVDLIDEDEALQREQDALDEHDDNVALLGIRIQRLITSCSTPLDSDPRKIASKRLTRVRKKLSSIGDTLASLPTEDDSVCLLTQLQEQLSEFKKEISDVQSSLLSFDLDESDELSELQASVEKGIFDCSLEIKKLLRPQGSDPTISDAKSVKLPRLDVPTFDGNILNWKAFWERFCISVHERPNISDPERLVYLQHAVKDGSAKHVIEGLSRSGEHYTEAVECLRLRYDRPRLIHQTHVRMIIEAPSLKDGSGKELRRLHDTILQHLRALKAMGHEPSGSFITSMLELKLDVNTMFEWQRHSQASTDVPHYQKLLDFINLRAQASEASPSEPSKRPHVPKNDPRSISIKRNANPSKPVASFTASADTAASNCILCKTERHPLYICAKFRALTHGEMMSILRSNGCCLNCLQPGHFSKRCKSLHRCKRCQKPHHTLLHVEANQKNTNESSMTPPSTTPISAHAVMGIKSDLLLMTCRVVVEAPDGSTVEARAILDSASSASFISERLASNLHLPRSKQNARISGVAGLVHDSFSQSITNCKISQLQDLLPRSLTSLQSSFPE